MSAATAGSLDQGRTDADPGATSTKGRRSEQAALPGGSSPVDDDTESLAASQPPKRGLYPILRASQRFIMRSVSTWKTPAWFTGSNDTHPATPPPWQGSNACHLSAFSTEESTLHHASISREAPAPEPVVAERSIEREIQPTLQQQGPTSREDSETEATVAERSSIKRGVQPTPQQQDPTSQEESSTEAVVERSTTPAVQPTLQQQQDPTSQEESSTEATVVERSTTPAVQPTLQHQEDTISREESSTEEIVEGGGITPGMLRTFVSKQHGFRLHVQGGSVPDGQISGPITVTSLKGRFMFEGVKLEAVLEVRCRPAGCKFDVPLLFDFPVEGGSKDCPIIDELGRIGYEVLTKDCDSNRWVRDSTPLEIVKDDQGKIYVRAQVHHFCRWSFFKKSQPLEMGEQDYKYDRIPRAQRQRHQSLIKNGSNVNIHVYAMRKSQWNAAMESAKVAAGAEGFECSIEASGRVHKIFSAAALQPQMTTIRPNRSHWFEIPRVGTGLIHSRKAVMAIVTAEPDDREPERMRLEAMIHVRCNTMVTVTLPVEHDKVIGRPVAAADGGILSLLMRVLQNHSNATPDGSPPSAGNTVARGSGTGRANSTTLSLGPTSRGEGTGRLSDGTSPDSFPLSTDSDTTGVSSAVNDATASSSCAPPAELSALQSRVG